MAIGYTTLLILGAQRPELATFAIPRAMKIA